MNNLTGRELGEGALPAEVNSERELTALSRRFSVEVFPAESVLPGTPRVMH